MTAIDHSTTEGDRAQRSVPLGDLVFALAGAATGVMVAIAASGIRVPPGSANAIGPRVFPYAIAAILVISSLSVVVSTLRGHAGEAEEGEDVDADASTGWATVGVLALLFAAFGLLIVPAGWPIAVTLLFGGTAWRLRAKRWWVALLIGLGMGLLTQYLFGTLLGISLPAGPLFDWIPIFDG